MLMFSINKGTGRITTSLIPPSRGPYHVVLFRFSEFQIRDLRIIACFENSGLYLTNDLIALYACQSISQNVFLVYHMLCGLVYELYMTFCTAYNCILRVTV